MGAHLIDGQFQSDKYPTTPRGKVPLSVTDPTAQDLLWEYAQRRRSVDAEFSEDLEMALRTAGYAGTGNLAELKGEREARKRAEEEVETLEKALDIKFEEHDRELTTLEHSTLRPKLESCEKALKDERTEHTQTRAELEAAKTDFKLRELRSARASHPPADGATEHASWQALFDMREVTIEGAKVIEIRKRRDDSEIARLSPGQKAVFTFDVTGGLDGPRLLDTMTEMKVAPRPSVHLTNGHRLNLRTGRFEGEPKGFPDFAVRFDYEANAEAFMLDSMRDRFPWLECSVTHDHRANALRLAARNPRRGVSGESLVTAGELLDTNEPLTLLFEAMLALARRLSPWWVRLPPAGRPRRIATRPLRRGDRRR